MSRTAGIFIVLPAALLFFSISADCGEIPGSIEKNRIGFLVGAPRETALIAEIGGGWVRPHPGPFAWQWIEPVKGEFDFRRTDRWVRAAQDSNIAILATVWPYADWDQEKRNGSRCEVPAADEFYPKRTGDGIPASRCAPYSTDDYKNFLTKLVERYDGDGVDDMPGLTLPVKYWEILNEPAMREPHLTFYKGTAHEYVELLKASREAVMSASSGCRVVQGGAAGTMPEMLDFWGEVFELGGGGYFDIANIHYINYGDLSTLNVRKFRELMSAKGVNKPIWVTEAGYNAEGEIEASARGAFAAGAEKIFFTQFKVGSYGPPRQGSYSRAYDSLIE